MKPVDNGDGIAFRVWNPTAASAAVRVVLRSPVEEAHLSRLEELPTESLELTGSNPTKLDLECRPREATTICVKNQ